MKLKASYTVEAAAIISFCLIVFGIAICLSYEMFTSVMEYVSPKEDSFDAVSLFRLREGAMGVLNAIKN